MVRYFFLSVNLLNSLLALAVFAVMYFAVIPLLNPVARISVPTVKQTGASSGGEETTPSQRVPVTDYAVISDKNLFHPERKIPQEKQTEKPIPKPEVFLYGTLIADDASYAFIEDKKAPYSTPGRGKRQITLKKGDRLSGYTLSAIEADRIVLVKGEEKLVVMLADGEKRRTGEVAAAPATPGGIGPSSPTAPSSPQAMPSPPQPGSRPPFPPGVSSPPQIVPSPAQAATMPNAGAAPGSGLSIRSAMKQELERLKLERQRPPQGSPGN